MHGDALDGARVDVAPSEMAMSTIERELASRKVGFESVLERALEPIKGSYDYVLIDCRPSTELLEHRSSSLRMSKFWFSKAGSDPDFGRFRAG